MIITTDINHFIQTKFLQDLGATTNPKTLNERNWAYLVHHGVPMWGYAGICNLRCKASEKPKTPTPQSTRHSHRPQAGVVVTSCLEGFLYSLHQAIIT